MKRTLSLKSEALAELTADDLAVVNGAAKDAAKSGLTCPVSDCVTMLTCRTCWSFPNC